MISEILGSISIQNLRLNMQAAMTQPPPPQVGNQIAESDNDKRVDNQMLLVKRIRAILGTEMGKLKIMKKLLQ